MWALDNRTGYAAGRNWTRDKHGVHWWLVAVRSTFNIGSQGKLIPADVQTPPILAPEYHGTPGSSSLRHDSDLLFIKPSTDILAHASAHAPRGRPATTVAVTLRVDTLEKTVVVFGERHYNELGTSAPRPFTGTKICYEHAFGGWDRSARDPIQHRLDERNPVGRGFARRHADLAGTPAHAVEYPSGAADTRGPAGFGPIDPAWLPRRVLAGTYDAAWTSTKKPLLPDDYDPAFALAAPVDQRRKTPLRGGERVALLNMTPDGTLTFELPRISLGFTTRFGRRTIDHDAHLATLLLEPDERRVSLTFQSALRVPAPDADYLDVTEIVEHRSTR